MIDLRDVGVGRAFATLDDACAAALGRYRDDIETAQDEQRYLIGALPATAQQVPFVITSTAAGDR